MKTWFFSQHSEDTFVVQCSLVVICFHFHSLYDFQALIEEKIQKIRSDIRKNQNLISDIKNYVQKMTRGDRKAANELQKLLDDAVKDSDKDKEGDQEIEKPAIKSPILRSKEPVKVSAKTCGLADAPNVKSDVQVSYNEVNVWYEDFFFFSFRTLWEVQYYM